MSEERIAAALRALAESDLEAEASPEVETRVMQAFRRRRRRKAALWTLAAAAAIVMAALFTANRRPAAVTRVIEPPRQVQVVAVPAAPKPVPAKRKRKAAPAPPVETVTDFFPLVDTAPPFERGELIRVVLPASALRTVGLPVNEDRLGGTVQADVLIGQEGLARAIRFVNFQQ